MPHKVAQEAFACEGAVSPSTAAVVIVVVVVAGAAMVIVSTSGAPTKFRQMPGGKHHLILSLLGLHSLASIWILYPDQCGQLFTHL